jgi:hypothetical protein
MVATPRSNGKRGYSCRKDRGGCGSVFALADPVEEYVVSEVLPVADSARMRQRIASDADTRALLLAALIREERDVDADLDKIAHAHFVEKVLGVRQYRLLSEELTAKVEGIRAKVAALQGDRVLERHAGRVAEMWPSMTLEQQRAVISGAVSSLTLAKHPKGKDTHVFVPEDRIRLTFRWSLLLDVAHNAPPLDMPEKLAAAEAEYERLNREAEAS